MALASQKKKKSFLENLYMNLNKPKLENKVILFRLLAVTQKAGLGIRESIQSIMKAETHPGVKKILKDILEQINDGVGLSTALEKYDDFFSSSEIELIRSAEQMGNLPETLESMAMELEKFEMIKKRIKSAMMYPVVVIIVTIFAVIILLLKVIPGIIEIFPSNAKLPGITVFVINASDYLKNNFMNIIAIIIGTPFVFSYLYKNFTLFKKYIDDFLLRVPVIGQLMKTFYRYRFSKLLGDFYNAGLSPLVALDQIYNIFQNYHYKKKIYDVKKDLEVGLEMTASFEGSRLFNPILVQIIGIGEKAGNVGEVLEKMATFYRNELDTKVEGLTKIIEPILMVFVAGVIGVIVASIFLPMADLISAIGG